MRTLLAVTDSDKNGSPPKGSALIVVSKENKPPSAETQNTLHTQYCFSIKLNKLAKHPKQS